MGLKVTFTNALSRKNNDEQANSTSIKLPNNIKIFNYNDNNKNNAKELGSRTITVKNNKSSIENGTGNGTEKKQTADFKNDSYNIITKIANLDGNQNDLTLSDLKMLITANSNSQTSKNIFGINNIKVTPLGNVEDTGRVKVEYNGKTLVIDMQTEKETEHEKNALKSVKDVSDKRRFRRNYDIKVVKVQGELMYKIKLKKGRDAINIKNNFGLEDKYIVYDEFGKPHKASALRYRNRELIESAERNADVRTGYDNVTLKKDDEFYLPYFDVEF